MLPEQEWEMGDYGLEVSKYKEEFLNIKTNLQGNGLPYKGKELCVSGSMQLQPDGQASDL